MATQHGQALIAESNAQEDFRTCFRHRTCGYPTRTSISPSGSMSAYRPGEGCHKTSVHSLKSPMPLPMIAPQHHGSPGELCPAGLMPRLCRFGAVRWRLGCRSASSGNHNPQAVQAMDLVRCLVCMKSEARWRQRELLEWSTLRRQPPRQFFRDEFCKALLTGVARLSVPSALQMVAQWQRSKP